MPPIISPLRDEVRLWKAFDIRKFGNPLVFRVLPSKIQSMLKDLYEIWKFFKKIITGLSRYYEVLSRLLEFGPGQGVELYISIRIGNLESLRIAIGVVVGILDRTVKVS